MRNKGDIFENMDIPITNKAAPALDLNSNTSQPPSTINQQPNPQLNNYNQHNAVSNNTGINSPRAAGVILAKGQRVSLNQLNPQLSMIEVGLGWDIPAIPGQVPYDLDAEAFLLDDNNRIVGNDWFVFYNQPTSPDGSVRHSGDNRTGDQQGDDETILVNLNIIDPRVKKVAFVVTINEALQRGQNFGGIKNAYIRVIDKASNNELVRFNLTEYYKEVVSMVIGELYFKNNEWRFNPVGMGTADDLLGLCRRYGVEVSG